MDNGYPHIEKRDGEAARLARVPRIRVAQIVMDYVFHGWSPDEICRHHPYLSPAEVHSAMAYYYDNQLEIDQEIARELKLDQELRDRTPPSPFLLRMRAKKAI